jgi:hypothetical protein
MSRARLTGHDVDARNPSPIERQTSRFVMVARHPPYIPHIFDTIGREFVRLVFLRVHLMRNADQREEFLLKIGQLREEDLNGAITFGEDMSVSQGKCS